MDKMHHELWQRYEFAKNIMDYTNLIGRTKENEDFYHGFQWGNVKISEELPVINWIEPVVKYKVSTVASNKITAMFTDISKPTDYEEPAYKAMNAKIKELFYRAKLSRNAWKAIKGAAIGGNSYTYWNSPDHCQVLPTTAVLLGDSKEQDIQNQPFVIVRERRFIKDVKCEAKENGMGEEVIANIVEDNDEEFQFSDVDDLDSSTEALEKVTSILYFQKIKGVVHYAKATENVIYSPLRPLMYEIDGELQGKGLTKYPIIDFAWEDVTYSARALGEVEPLKANQVQYNKLMFRRLESIKACAFPVKVYNSDYISNPEDLDKVGMLIESSGDHAINELVGYISPAQLSGDATSLPNDIMTTTREVRGASESTLGQIDPTRVAASAISALQDQAAIHIKEQISKYEEWIEKTAELLWEMIILYDEVYVQDEEGNDVKIPEEKLEEMVVDVKIDVVQETPMHQEAFKAELIKLLDMQLIDLEMYLEMIPDSSPVPKEKMLSKLKEKKAEVQNEMQQMQ